MSIFLWSHLCTISNSSDKCFSLPGLREGAAFTEGNSCPAFRQMEESKELFAFTVSQLPYAKVAYFGVAYTGSLYIIILSLSFFFFWPDPWHMEVSGPGIKSELQL